MSQFKGLLQSIARAKPPVEYSNKLDSGQHRLALERFEPKIITKKNNTQAVLVEADFTVIESTVHKPGETLGWTWFPGDEFGYQDGRIRALVETIGKCVGDDTNVEALADQLFSPGQPGRGVVLQCTVVTVLNKDGSARMSDKGVAVKNANFSPVQQTLEQVAATRAELDDTKPLRLVAETQKPAPEPVRTQPVVGGSLLGSIGRR